MVTTKYELVYVCPLMFNQIILPAMLAWHVIFNKNSIYMYSQGGQESNEYINGRAFFAGQFQMCHEISNIYIMKDSSQYMYFWEKVLYARYFWDWTQPFNWLFGSRILCVQYFSQKSFLNFYSEWLLVMLFKWLIQT